MLSWPEFKSAKSLVLAFYYRTKTNFYGEMAERSKALESGSSPKGRGFESHFRQN